MSMRKTKILMVEDEPSVRKMNTAYLEGQGYEVIEAATASETRSVLAQQVPDVILLDVLLPDGSGFDLCSEIRSITTAPIIYLTAKDENESVVTGLSLGADDYITKPYDLDVLGARVSAVIRRTGSFLHGRVELPPLEIDLVTGVTTIDGKPVSLSNKEMQLLAYLAANAGRRIPDRELYDAVWGDTVSASSQTLGVHVSYLRNKLKLKEPGSKFRLLHDKGDYIFIRAD
jgi:DNA-binding response OmpR family regulator